MQLLPLRRISQSCIFAFFIIVPLLNLFEINTFAGNLLSFSFAGLPFADPLAALQVTLSTFSFIQTMLIGAGIVLGVAFLLGPVFCSWICPYGLFSELVMRSRSTAALTTDAHRLPFLTKLLIVCSGLLVMLLFVPVPLLNQLSMPGWITRSIQYAFLYKEFLLGSLLVPTILILEYLTKKRLWCQYICPQSVLLSLAGLLFPKRLRVHFSRSHCTCSKNDRPCLSACTLQLNPRKQDVFWTLQCTNCGDCTDACAKRGKALYFTRPPAQSKSN